MSYKRTLASFLLSMHALSAEHSSGGSRGGGGGGAHAESSHSVAPRHEASHVTHTGSAPSMSRAAPRSQKVPQKSTPQHNSKTQSDLKQFLKEHSQKSHLSSKTEKETAKSVARAQHTMSSRHKDEKNWFTNRFFRAHNEKNFAGHHHRNWWASPGLYDLDNWFGWDYTNSPYYSDDNEDYGYAAPEVATSPSLPSATPTEAPEDTSTEEAGDWLPLGIFTAAENVEGAGYSQMVVQLAVDKAGTIQGTYYNAATDKAYPLQGYIDPDTQQAAWKMSDREDAPITTTGTYNFTKAVVPITVHFPDGTEQPWVLVRMQET